MARDYLIDTNTASYWFDEARGEHARVRARIESLSKQSPARLFFSRLSLGEVEYGYQLGGSVVDKRSDFASFLEDKRFVLLELEAGTAEEYGRVRAALFNTFAPKQKKKALRPEQLLDPVTANSLGIQENDLWIAAQALALDLTLVTHDRMERIRLVAPDLVAEDWVIGS